MKKNTIISLFTLTVVTGLFTSSCSKDEGKIPQETPTVALCDTITYTKHIKPIVDLNCAISGCHDGTNSRPLLSTYDQVKDRADAGRIKARAIDPTSSPMPPASQTPLTSDQKKLISCWLDNGKKQ